MKPVIPEWSAWSALIDRYVIFERGTDDDPDDPYYTHHGVLVEVTRRDDGYWALHFVDAPMLVIPEEQGETGWQLASVRSADYQRYLDGLGAIAEQAELPTQRHLAVITETVADLVGPD